MVAMAQADRTYTRGTDERTALTQFIADSHLAVHWLLQDIGQYGLLDDFVHSVLQIGPTPILVQQGLRTASVLRFLITIERVARHAHDLAGLRNIAQLISQAQQAQLVFDDRLIYNIHTG